MAPNYVYEFRYPSPLPGGIGIIGLGRKSRYFYDFKALMSKVFKSQLVAIVKKT